MNTDLPLGDPRAAEAFESARGEGVTLLRLSLLAALIGLAAGVAAFVLYRLIALIGNLVFFGRADASHLPTMAGHHLGAWVIAVPALGGLVVGLMARYGSPKIRGHGIPEAIEAVLVSRSRIAPRVAWLKPLSAAIAIGTGGPFGAEGPIIQTGGALGSLCGQLLHVTASERKVLLACGAAAGMAATFSTPIAAVILALELLLFEFRSRSFIPLVVATTIATAIHFALLGRGAMFSVAAADWGVPRALPAYALLGVVCGFAAVGFTRALYWVEDQFEKLPFDPMWWPALGGALLGVIGWIEPRVLGVGYAVISAELAGRLALATLLALAFWKALALVVSLGSGTSGGLLAPMFLVGAAIGGAFAEVADRLWPALHLSPAACALLGMAAMFGAAARATFALIVFAFELTRDYGSILPLMLVCVVADAVALGRLRHSIMTEKLARRGLHVASEYTVDVLDLVHVGEAMEPAGVGELATTPAAVTGDGAALVAFADESLRAAVDRMAAHAVTELIVIDRAAPPHVLGAIGIGAILEARRRRLVEEHVREPGWLGRRRSQTTG